MKRLIRHQERDRITLDSQCDQIRFNELKLAQRPSRSQYFGQLSISEDDKNLMQNNAIRPPFVPGTSQVAEEQHAYVGGDPQSHISGEEVADGDESWTSSIPFPDFHSVSLRTKGRLHF